MTTVKLSFSACWARSEDKLQALSISKETSLPLGRIFVMSNLISEDCLTRVVRCQSLLKEHVVDLPTARKAMDLVTRSEFTVDEAVSRLGWLYFNEQLEEAEKCTREYIRIYSLHQGEEHPDVDWSLNADNLQF